MSAADLERWERRWRARAEAPPGAPEPVMAAQASALAAGPVLDAAAGDGRNALFLAARGLPVTALDIAPAALARLARAALERGLEVATRLADLDGLEALQGLGPFQSLLVIRYHPTPSQWDRLIAVLAPGGRLLLCSFGLDQHRRHGFPRAFCLVRDELEAMLGDRLALSSWESFAQDDEHLEGSLWQKAG
jgi:SAM-dependent methyltransferase